MILLRRARLLVTDAGGEARGGRRDTGRLPCAPCWRKPRLTTSANASSCPRKRSRGGKPHGTEAVTTSGAGREHRPGACKDRENPREPTQAICQGNTGLGRGPRLPWSCVLRTCLPSPNKYHMLFNGSIGRKDHFSGVRPGRYAARALAAKSAARRDQEFGSWPLGEYYRTHARCVEIWTIVYFGSSLGFWRTECIWGRGYAMLPVGGWLR